MPSNVQKLKKSAESKEIINCRTPTSKTHYKTGKQNPIPQYCSTLQLPANVVNKRCIFESCNNFKRLAANSHVKTISNDDKELPANQEYGVPMTCTDSQLLKDAEINSSLMQILQHMNKTLKKDSIKCVSSNKVTAKNYINRDNISSPRSAMWTTNNDKGPPILSSSSSLLSRQKTQFRSEELSFEREPKCPNYLSYLEPRKCKCAKITKKHLQEQMPSYMRNVSHYDTPEMLNYETCSVDKLKYLVKMARGKTESPSPSKMFSKTMDDYVQCNDSEFKYLCVCYSDEDLKKFYDKVIIGGSTIKTSDPLCASVKKFEVVGDSTSSSYLAKTPEKFMADRVQSWTRLFS